MQQGKGALAIQHKAASKPEVPELADIVQRREAKHLLALEAFTAYHVDTTQHWCQ